MAKRADLTQSEIDPSEGRLARLRGNKAAPAANAAPAAEKPARVPAGALGLLAAGGGLLLAGAGAGCGGAALAEQNSQPAARQGLGLAVRDEGACS